MKNFVKTVLVTSAKEGHKMNARTAFMQQGPLFLMTSLVEKLICFAAILISS